MNGWQEMLLGELAIIQTGPFGSQLHADDYVQEGVPSIMPQNIGVNSVDTTDIARIASEDAKRLEKYLVAKGDIVFSRRGDVRRRALIRDRENGWLCGTGCLRVRFKDAEKLVHPEFASYYLGLPKILDWIEGNAVGTTMANLNSSILKDLPFLLPSFEEQKAIAEILSSLDEKIELNRKQNRILEAIAQTLFKRWFVEFEFPFDFASASLSTGAQGKPDENGNPYKSSGGAMQPSELGEIPAGWGVGQFGDVAANIKAPVKPGLVDAELVYVGLEHIGRKNLGLEEWGRASDVESNKSEFAKNDVLFGKLRPYFHKVAIAPLSGICSTDILVLRAKQPVYSGFVTLLAFSESFVNYSNNASTGTRMPRANWKHMAEYKLALPPEGLAQMFEDVVLPITEKIQHNTFENRVLSNIRDTLLPKLMSGELRVGEQSDTKEQEG
jgi:type I restriction enzyme S subunit